ncbi:6227_t:CDS:1 [Funneliformis geosporum]|uniref:3432_t:CDS:1 n=1 Tax=Funneliformis geosporum TaxID=1117311 RepID=A0A9W4SV40_9GLOM|nr:3432_t:CDS:1 [Funneliformis geosporum]CAI2187749.1 6227_t:CDS:1 [Funneliformis geosporum]
MSEVRKKLRKRVRVTEAIPNEIPKKTNKSNKTTDADEHTAKKIKETAKPFTRGVSLTLDLTDMINNPLYSDIIITCKDGEELNACKLLLSARSEYFNKLFSSTKQEAKDSTNKINIAELPSSAVKVVLEYLYTGNVSDKTLTIDILSDAYNGATVFLLPNLKEMIVQFMKTYMKHRHNVSSSNQIAKILSKVSDNSIITTLSSSDDDNQLIDEICRFLMSKSLYNIEYQNFSSKALEFLLHRTLNIKEGNFVTPEYDVFKYCILWAVDQISRNDVLNFWLLLPNNEDSEGQESFCRECNPIDSNNELLKQHRSTISSILKSILNYIDFRLIHPNILANVIEPLEIVNPSILIAAYRYQAQLNDGFVQTRRVQG